MSRFPSELLSRNVCVRAVWSEYTLGAFWIAEDTMFPGFMRTNKTDWTVRMRRLIWVSVGHSFQKVPFLKLRLISLLGFPVLPKRSDKHGFHLFHTMGKFTRRQIDDTFLIVYLENRIDNSCKLSPKERDNLHHVSKPVKKGYKQTKQKQSCHCLFIDPAWHCVHLVV